MTTQPNVTSTGITNLNATPPVRNTAGTDNGLGRLYKVTAVIGPTTSGDTTGGILRGVRIPSNARLLSVTVFQKAATSTATFDIGLDYSNAPLDGTSPGNYVSGSPFKGQAFGASVDTHAYIVPTQVAFLNTSGYLPTDIVNPIWQAGVTGLTSDPGGFFDIILTNTATISGAATMIVSADYVVE